MKDFYIYNYLQADYFIKKGVLPVGCGKGSKGGIYVRFKRDKKSEDVQELWLKEKYGDSPRPPRKE